MDRPLRERAGHAAAVENGGPRRKLTGKLDIGSGHLDLEQLRMNGCDQSHRIVKMDSFQSKLLPMSPESKR